MALDTPSFPTLTVNLEWLVGFNGTLANNPAVGGESNLLMSQGPSLGLYAAGRI